MNVKDLNLKYVSMLLCMMLMGISFTACSDDNDEPDPDYASKVKGTYVGSGKCMYLDLLEEDSWPGMKVVVTRSSDNYVILGLMEANNTPILENSRAYEVLQSGSGWLLRDPQATNVSVTIDKDGNMVYYNPNITVGGEEGYSISFTGKKEKE